MSENGNQESDDDQEENSEDVPKRWVESWFQIEDSGKDILNEVRELQIDDQHEEVRKLVVNFRDNRHDAFRGIYYSLLGTDAFYNDVSDQMGEETVERLKKLEDTYSDLKDEFQLVDTINGTDRNNLITRGEMYTKYEPSEKQVLIRYTGYSVDKKVYQHTDKISGILFNGGMIIDSVINAVDYTLENDLELNDAEMESILDHVEEIDSDIDELKSKTNEIIEMSDSNNRGDEA